MNFQNRDIGWKYDLPSPNSPPETQDRISQLYTPPDHIDAVYMDISRSTFLVRGIWLAGASTPLILGSGFLIFIIIYAYDFMQRDIQLTLIITSIIFLMYFLVTPYIRMDIELPRNEPIRFNRVRRKVYFYQYRYDLLHPLGRKNWGIRPVAYDWDHLTAEAYSIGRGGLHETIRLSVRNPDTDEVIDRVLFANSIEVGKEYWAIVRRFMQEGPEALPEFAYAPTDWSKEPSNPFERLAPKVQWPAEMDLESRTAPSPEEQQP